MYLSLKTILLGAAFASAIPIANNGTNNVTLFQQPTLPGNIAKAADGAVYIEHHASAGVSDQREVFRALAPEQSGKKFKCHLKCFAQGIFGGGKAKCVERCMAS